MTSVTIFPKYQIVILKAVRERLQLSPGQKVEAFAFGNRIELIPVRPITESRGMLSGMDTEAEREIWL